MNFPVLTYTMLSDAENCPHKFYRKYVLKDLPYQESTPAMKAGIKLHDAMEARLAKGITLDREYRSAEPICRVLDELAEHKGVSLRVEYKMAMKIDGSPCAWDAQGAWLRTKADMALWTPDGGWLIDWKNGKIREQPFELEVQGLLLSVAHNVWPLQGEYFWMAEKRCGNRYTLEPDKTFMRVGKLYAELMGYFNMVIPDPLNAFPKRQNPLRGWCPVANCEHNKTEKKG